MAYEDSELESPADYRCESCSVLVDALREAERQCREAEDERAVILTTSNGSLHAGFEHENEFLARIRKLERRRDCALEVLLKHQRFEHM